MRKEDIVLHSFHFTKKNPLLFFDQGKFFVRFLCFGLLKWFCYSWLILSAPHETLKKKGITSPQGVQSYRTKEKQNDLQKGTALGMEPEALSPSEGFWWKTSQIVARPGTAPRLGTIKRLLLY